jgi:hypothetical protein
MAVALCYDEVGCDMKTLVEKTKEVAAMIQVI